MRTLFALGFLSCVFSPGHPLRLQLKTGQLVPGLHVRLQDEKRMLLLTRYYSFTLPVDEVDKMMDGESDPKEDTPVTPGLSWRGALDTLTIQRWVKDAWQIPAQPLASGPFKDVPYLSHRLGANAVFNAYGNPMQCCGFEFVLSGEAAGDLDTRRGCQDALAKMHSYWAWAGKVSWVGTIESLNLKGDRKQAKGAAGPLPAAEEIVAEVSADKAGWRIAAWNVGLLDKARVAKKELDALTLSVQQIEAEEREILKTVANLAPDDPRFVPELAYLWRVRDLRAEHPDSLEKKNGPDRFFFRGYERGDKGYRRNTFVPIRR